jgi:hypothetical protein
MPKAEIVIISVSFILKLEMNGQVTASAKILNENTGKEISTLARVRLQRRCARASFFRRHSASRFDGNKLVKTENKLALFV